MEIVIKWLLRRSSPVKEMHHLIEMTLKETYKIVLDGWSISDCIPLKTKLFFFDYFPASTLYLLLTFHLALLLLLNIAIIYSTLLFCSITIIIITIVLVISSWIISRSLLFFGIFVVSFIIAFVIIPSSVLNVTRGWTLNKCSYIIWRWNKWLTSGNIYMVLFALQTWTIVVYLIEALLFIPL